MKNNTLNKVRGQNFEPSELNKEKNKKINFSINTIKGQVIGMSVLMAAVITILLTISLYLVNNSVKITNQVINLRTPCTLHSIKLLNGVNESLAALRGYIIIGNQKFVTKRNEAWGKNIKVSLEKLQSLDECWVGTDDKVRLDSVVAQLEALEKYQQEIEEIAYLPDNIPANRILNETINPLAETMFADMTVLINSIGGTSALDAKRKVLLMTLAEMRGAQGMAVANIKTYTSTGDAEHLKAYNKYWESTQKKYADLAQTTSLLNAAQAENFRSLGETRSKMEASAQQLIAERSKQDWNKANYWLSTKAAPTAIKIDKNLNDIMANQQSLMEKETGNITDNVNTQKNIAYLLLVFGILSSILLGMIMSRKILGAIYKLRDYILVVGQGELPEPLPVTQDETGEMIAASNFLVSNLKNVRDFAIEVGRGKFDTDINVFNNQGALGSALAEMRNSLKNVSEEDKKRNWITEGLAKFGETLRTSSDNLEELSNEIISNLTKYLNANQGRLFIIVEGKEAKPFLELTACYAWNKRKYIQQRIEFGEGLVGQAWQENETIYITDIPDNYVEITSGIGKANPRSVLIIPMKINDITYGIIELASFQEFQKHEIDFIQKLGESIASTISSVKINARTKVLLEESQQQSEELKAQEEEMRQNMEEMQATQEEMHRKEKELQNLIAQAGGKEEKLKQIVKQIQLQKSESLIICNIIDVAGRNRMLSQRLAFYAERIASGDETIKEDARQIIEMLNSSMKALREGGVALGMPYHLPATTDKNSLLVIEQTEAVWVNYKTIIQSILNEPLFIKDMKNLVVINAIDELHRISGIALSAFNKLTTCYINMQNEKQHLQQEEIKKIIEQSETISAEVFNN